MHDGTTTFDCTKTESQYIEPLMQGDLKGGEQDEAEEVVYPGVSYEILTLTVNNTMKPTAITSYDVVQPKHPACGTEFLAL